MCLVEDRTCGARRVWREVLAEGIDCGLHCIERLMRVQALRALSHRRSLAKDQRSAIAPNTLGREFRAERPNQRWITDFTQGKAASLRLLAARSTSFDRADGTCPRLRA